MAVSREAIFDSRVEWGPLPNFKSLKGDRSERSDKNSDKNSKQAADKVTAEKPKGNFECFYIGCFVNDLMSLWYTVFILC